VTACLAKKYDALYDSEGHTVLAEFEAINAENTEADFNAVTLADCTEEDYKIDSIKAYIETEDWLEADYSQGAPIYSASTQASNGWIIRSQAGDTYSRVKVKTVDVVFGAETTRKVTLSSQYYNGVDFDGAIDSHILDYSNEKAYWDLESNSLVTADDNWDLAISVEGDSYPIQTNGGASGEGAGGVGAVDLEDAFAVTDPTDGNQVYTYFTDSANGAMAGPGYYGALEYGVAGGHDMWANYAIYIFKDGDNYYKAQVLSNYGESGALASGNIFLRYEKLN